LAALPGVGEAAEGADVLEVPQPDAAVATAGGDAPAVGGEGQGGDAGGQVLAVLQEEGLAEDFAGGAFEQGDGAGLGADAADGDLPDADDLVVAGGQQEAAVLAVDEGVAGPGAPAGVEDDLRVEAVAPLDLGGGVGEDGGGQQGGGGQRAGGRRTHGRTSRG